MTESAYNVYGFKAKQGDIEFGNGTEKDFLLAIQNGIEQKGKYYEEYKRIYDYLRGKKKAKRGRCKSYWSSCNRNRCGFTEVKWSKLRKGCCVRSYRGK